MMLEQRPKGWERASLLKVWRSMLQAVGEVGVEEELPTETTEAPPCPVAEPMSPSAGLWVPSLFTEFPYR